MWEFSVSVDNENADCMTSLYARLFPAVKRAEGVIVASRGARASVSVACEEGREEGLMSVLADSIGDIIVDDFKFKYLKRHSRIPDGDAVNYNAFMTALVSFDREWDKETVTRELFYNRELPIDGFYNFRLKELKNRWSEVCRLASENSGYLEYADTFTELLKFLINSSERRAGTVRVEKRGGVYKLYPDDAPPRRGGERRSAESAEPDGAEAGVCRTDEPRSAAGARLFAPYAGGAVTDETLLPALIRLAPRRIVLTAANVPDNVLALLRGVYGEVLTVEV